jgi:hypothetical protein
MALVLTAALAQGRDLLQLRQQPDQRILIYRAAGEWLEANTPENAWVGVLEAGAIGYYAQRPMVDFAGLIQPEVAAQITPATTYADTAQWAVERYQPDYLALPGGTFADLEAGYIARSCQLVKDFPGQEYGFPSDLNIYACRS